MKKTVLILANKDSGLANFRRELLQRLQAENVRVIAALPFGDRVADLEALGCECVDVKLARRGANPIADWNLYRSFKKIVKETRPNIVFTYTIKPNVYGGMACQALGVPYVANVTGLGSAVENPGPLQHLTVALYKKGLKKAQKVFFQNEANQQFMLDRGMVRGPYDLLPGSGVNLERFQAREYPSDETIGFLFAGRIMKEKGIDQYLEAASYIRKKYESTRFYVCGAYEDDYKDVVAQRQSDGTIEYLGVLKDMTEMYQKIHCTVHPTFYPEGLSNVLLETAATARPIITTNRPGCREVVDDGVNGFFANQRDSKDLIEKIEKFLALSWEERRQMGLAGRAKAERSFNRQIVVDKYLQELG